MRFLRIKFRLFILIVSCCLTHLSFAAKAITPPEKPDIIKVGVIDGPPISYLGRDRAWHGIVVDLWQEIATDNNWQYEFIPMGENVENAIDEVADKKLDVLIGPLTVTHSRLTKVDFSRPFMINKVVVLERGLPIDHFASLLMMILSKTLNIFFVMIAVTFLIIAHIIWALERKTLKEFGNGYIRGILHAIWALLMLLVGSQLVDHPKHHLSRFLLLLVIFLSIIFSSLVAAAFTSSLTLSLVPEALSPEKSLKELQNKSFASVTGQSTGSTMQNLGGSVIYFKTLKDTLHALKTDQNIDAIVGDSVILKYSIAHSSEFSKLSVTPISLVTDEYAVAFRRDSALREKFDYGLTKLQEENRMMPICLRYLSEGDAAACVI